MEKRAIKQFKDLTIQDDFMFCKVMQNIDICKKVLQLVLKDKNISIKKITPQHTIENYSESKSVRLDVLVEDDKDNKFDVEMQMVNNDNIPKRMRFYQSSIDSYMTEKGTPYADLSDTIIIFFCMFDAIGKSLPIYTFKNLCEEMENVRLNDGTVKIIINVPEYKKVKNYELRGLLEYICDKSITTSLAEEIEMNVATIKKDKIILKEYHSFYAKMQDEREAGRKEGWAEGRTEGMKMGRVEGMKMGKVEGMKMGRVEGMKMGRVEGMKMGRVEGIYNAKIETAQNCLNLNMPIETIVAITGLPEEEIKKL